MKRLMCKRLAGVAVTALALTLAGCGGSSNTQQNPTDTPLQAAQKSLMTAEEAVGKLAADASDADQLDAQEKLLAAAKKVVEELRESDAPVSDVEAAEKTVSDAEAEISTIRGRIATAQGRMGAIGDAKDDLMAAQGAVSATPTAAEHQAIANAAGGVVTALQTNGGSQSDIDMYMDVQKLAQAWADYLTADAGVTALTDSSTDVAIRDAHQARNRTATELLAMLTDAAEIRTVTKAQVESEAAASGASTRITKAEDDRLDQQRKDRNAASMQVAEAIMAHSISTSDGDRPPEFQIGNTPDAGLRFTRSSGDAMFTLNQDATAAKGKSYDDDVAAPNAGTGWMGKMFTYVDSDEDDKNPDPMESAVVYTNIEKAGELAWTAEAFGGLDGITVDDDNDGAVSITGGTSLDVVHFTGGILPPTPSSSDTGIGTTKEIEDEVEGTFYGVSGDFSCGSGCILTRTPAGQVTVPSGATLTFAPVIPRGKDAGDLKAKYADADDDYLHFGYWMQSTKQDDDTYDHVIKTFAGGNGSARSLSSSFEMIQGKAEYSGVAGGRYVKKSDFDSEGNAGEVMDGTFVADVELTAHFGSTGGTVAAATQWSISGEVSDFMDVMDGRRDLGWTLKLDKANLSSGKDLDNQRSTSGVAQMVGGSGFFGKTTGGAGADKGDWSGAMHGNAGSETTSNAADDHPTGIAGEFNGHFVDGHIAGAFGATKD